MDIRKYNCPICGKNTNLLGKIDVDRDCLRRLNTSGKKFIEYYTCSSCKFTFAPEAYIWTNKFLRENIYNKDYIIVDPDFAFDRPNRMAINLAEIFKDIKQIRHLDYGGGSGLMSKILQDKFKWNSSCYDPFMESSYEKPTGKYNLISSIEVFEHSLNPQKLMQDISKYLSSSGILLFTTWVSDKVLSSEWDYIAPRNGHVSIYSYKSLQLLAQQHSLNFKSFSENAHIMWKKCPNWAQHLVAA